MNVPLDVFRLPYRGIWVCPAALIHRPQVGGMEGGSQIWEGYNFQTQWPMAPFLFSPVWGISEQSLENRRPKLMAPKTA